MKLSTAILAEFISGDIKIQDKAEKTHFLRGPIKTAVVEDNMFTVEFWWLARTINGTKGPDEWTNVENPQPWSADLNDYSVQYLNGMIILISATTLRMTVVLPPDGSKLNPSHVAGLELQ